MLDSILSFISSAGVILLLAVPFVILIALPFLYRIVVPTNMVHIVQSGKKTISYGTGQVAGNVYYKWPSWVPAVGVNTITLPISNFDLSFKDYEAYDKDRVPFVLDITAFFRIADTNKAAERVSNVIELHAQLKAIVQGAVRKILASHDIHSVMTDRATFGVQFTEEVKEELKNWGVEPVKSIELMDMRDSAKSTIIADIMAKKSSQITMESKVEVAQNKRKGDIAEIEAKQTVDLRTVEASQLVGKRTAEKDQSIGIAQQQSQQEIAREQVKTTQQLMEVRKVTEVRNAEIQKETAIVQAEQQKRTTVLNAEGKSEALAAEAKGRLESTELEAKGIAATGAAVAEAEKLRLMAPVDAQVVLAKEIGENLSYQDYLIKLEGIKAGIEVGKEQAKALVSADVKIIANASNVSEGVKNVGEIFSAKGGLNLASMVEGLSSTPAGQKIVEGVTGLLTAKSES